MGKLKISPAVKKEIEALQNQITDLEKKLKTETATKDTYHKMMFDAQGEIEQVHCLLDALPGSANRKSDGEDTWSRKDLRTMTRLAAYLANRGGNV